MKVYLRSHRRLALVVSVLAVGACVSRLAPLAQPGGSAAPWSTDRVVAAISDVFGLEPTEVSLTPAPPRHGRTCWDVALGGGHKPLWVSCDPKQGSLIIMCRGVRSEGGPDVGLANARQMGDAIARSRFAEARDDLKLTSAVTGAMGVYHLAWRVEPAPWVCTGDGCSVTFTKAGEVASYGERRAPRRVMVSDTRVTREEAESTALRIAKRGQHGNATLTLAYALLVLSSPLSSDQGPVWQVAYECTDPDTGERLAPPYVFLDALSGKELAAAR